MSLLTPYLSQILEPRGFYNAVVDLTPILTIEQAYEEVERSHEAVCNKRRYKDVDSFRRIKKRYDQERD